MRELSGGILRAYIEKESEELPLEVTLLDNGSGADTIANDGLYSRYFANFEEDGRYILRCQVMRKRTKITTPCSISRKCVQVVGDENTDVNGGFIIEKRREVFFNRFLSPRGYPLDPTAGGAPICCGSNTVNENTIREPTGNFSRTASGGSISVKNVPSGDIFPPNRVSNLLAKKPKDNDTIDISFTAPGDDYDSGFGKKALPCAF